MWWSLRLRLWLEFRNLDLFAFVDLNRFANLFWNIYLEFSLDVHRLVVHLGRAEIVVALSPTFFLGIFLLEFLLLFLLSHFLLNLFKYLILLKFFLLFLNDIILERREV